MCICTCAISCLAPFLLAGCPALIFSLTNNRNDNADALSRDGGRPPEDFVFTFEHFDSLVVIAL